MYPAREMDNAEEEKKDWDSWGRPQGGFVDLGCVSGFFSVEGNQLTGVGQWSTSAHSYRGGLSVPDSLDNLGLTMTRVTEVVDLNSVLAELGLSTLRPLAQLSLKCPLTFLRGFPLR